jgi:hypothetical protein
MQKQFEANAARPLFTGVAVRQSWSVVEALILTYLPATRRKSSPTCLHIEQTFAK